MPPPADRLPIAPWMVAPGTRAVFAALQAVGGPDAARFVGGCVRNALIGRPIDDVDIATPLEPPAVMQALQAAGVRFVPTGVEHGTVTAIAEGRPYEVTSLRRDVATDGRRAVVAFTRDWGEDAQRRDFRLNALYMDAEGQVYDPVGHGVQDALAGRIVFVGDARTRIREDYLRILRFFRFLAWYGRGPPDAEGLQACADLKDGLSQLSAERVSKELLKLLAAEDPVGAVRLMAEAGVLAAAAPEARNLDRFERLVRIERAIMGAGEAELRLAALWPADPVLIAAEADRLRLSKAQRGRLVAAAAPEPKISAGLDPVTVRRILYAEGAQAFRDRVKLAWAGVANPMSDPHPWLGLIEQADRWARPKFPLSGADAVAAGLAPGPAVGAALREAEAFWIAEDFEPGRAALLQRLKGPA